MARGTTSEWKTCLKGFKTVMIASEWNICYQGSKTAATASRLNICSINLVQLIRTELPQQSFFQVSGMSIQATVQPISTDID